jgi:hypothetical protein
MIDRGFALVVDVGDFPYNDHAALGSHGPVETYRVLAVKEVRKVHIIAHMGVGAHGGDHTKTWQSPETPGGAFIDKRELLSCGPNSQGVEDNVLPRVVEGHRFCLLSDNAEIRLSHQSLLSSSGSGWAGLTVKGHLPLTQISSRP